MGHYNSFIVRVWTDEADGTVRGHIQHVGTQEETYFANLDKMVVFIEGHLSLSPASLSETDSMEAIISFQDMRTRDE